jgi:hypothetical protein
MNSKTVLNKIMSLLSKTEVELTYAKLADGTIVESATFDVGEDLFVVSEDGTKTPAPNGFHDLMLKDEEGKETMFKVKTEEGKIVERENVEVEMADEKVKDIPQAGTYTKDDEVPEVAGEIKSGTLKMEEETDEVETLPEDATKEDKSEMDLGKMMQDMAYRIEEMEKKMMKMEETMMPPVDEEVDEEVMEEEELPKLDGAPIDEATKLSAELNRKNYGKKVATSQSAFLSKLYK